MSQQTFKELLISLNACKEAIKWAGNKTWEEVYTTCHRGDWLLWLFAKTNPNNLKELTLAKGHCANTVRHLMTDERSIAAVDAAIAFGEGKISKEELDAAADAAYAAAAAAAAAVAAAAYAAYVTADAAAAAAAAKKENQQQTADIVRSVLPIEIWNIDKHLSQEDVQKITDILNNPPEPNEELKNAAMTYSEWMRSNPIMPDNDLNKK